MAGPRRPRSAWRATWLVITAAVVCAWASGPAIGTETESDSAEIGIETLRSASEAGDVDSTVELGLRYLMGNGVERDGAEAMRLLLIAASAGHPSAMHNVGILHYNGIGVPLDRSEAFRWYERAAELGVATAQQYLGNMLWIGEGVEQDRGASIYWYERAVASGDLLSMRLLSQKYLYGEHVARDLGRAIEILEMAAERGDVDALITIGAIYASGDPELGDIDAAIATFERAAEQGSLGGVYNLGVAYLMRAASDQDLGRGAAMLGSAHEAGHESAEATLREMWSEKSDAERVAMTRGLRAVGVSLPGLSVVPAVPPGLTSGQYVDLAVRALREREHEFGLAVIDHLLVDDGLGDGTRTEAMKLRGVALLLLGREEDGVRALNEVIVRVGADLTSLVEIAELLAATGHVDKAGFMLDRMVEEFPDAHEPLTARANVTLLTRPNFMAIQEYTEILEKHPNAVGARVGRGNAFLQDGFTFRAHDDYAAALAVDADDSDALFGSCVAKRRLGCYRNALADCRRAAAARSGDPFADTGTTERVIADLETSIGDGAPEACQLEG